MVTFTLKFCFLLVLIAQCSAVTFNCTFNPMGHMKFGQLYGCMAQVVENDGDGSTLLQVNGNHTMDWQRNSHVGMLMVMDMNQTLNQIPRGVGTFFTGIVSLYWPQGNITTLTREDLEQFPFLRSLNMMGQKLRTLDGNLFQNHLEMMEIDFSMNELMYIGADLILNLRNLSSAMFLGNRCIYSFAMQAVDVSRLSVLFAAHCRPIETIPTTKQPGQLSRAFF
jgi:hypothetical protein